MKCLRKGRREEIRIFREIQAELRLGRRGKGRRKGIQKKEETLQI